MPNSKISRTAPETQEASEWSAPTGTLGELVASARIRAETESRAVASDAAAPRGSFEASLKAETVAIIAEVKRRSPSHGAINPGLDPARLARQYAEGGASAISVLTEPSRFGGSLADIAAVKQVTSLPVLRKDFLVMESQLAAARRAGASAALIIVRAIEPGRLVPLAREAVDLGLEILFEVRDEAELARAVDAGARIIGVNNRNLETLEIDMTTAERLIPKISPECVAVAESGYSTREQAESAARAGADALLTGSFLSAADDAAVAVRSLAGMSRVSRKAGQ